MSSRSLPEIMASGVGRRIFGFFLLAGVLPVAVTALLAYLEIGRGLEQDVSRQLRGYSKSYGIEFVERLMRSSQKAGEIVRLAEVEGETDFSDQAYLTRDFVSISSSSAAGGTREYLGNDRFLFSEGAVNREHLANGRDQLYIADEFGLTSYYLLRATNVGRADQRVYAFQLDPARPRQIPGDARAAGRRIGIGGVHHAQGGGRLLFRYRRQGAEVQGEEAAAVGAAVQDARGRFQGQRVHDHGIWSGPGSHTSCYGPGCTTKEKCHPSSPASAGWDRRPGVLS